MFSTFTPATRGLDVRYGLDGFDGSDTQTVGSLLRLPWHDRNPQQSAVSREGL
jgi:hypothetical protein